MNLPPVYDPSEVESRWYGEWESKGYFKPDLNAREGTFTIVIPPPNVTGILHMGHALNNTLQDILIRWKRMQGYAALWVPGTDHAGIATQNVVERQLAKEKITRQQLGREEFVKRVWVWREQYGSTIVRQLRRLGSSCDWSRERFTMDEGLSKAVRTAFEQLYKEGLIYRDYRIVNWCPRCQSALSDEEVIHEEINGHLWYIRYPFLSEEEGDGVIVATTRPETMLGDTAVAVHPNDERYKSFIGKIIALPLSDRHISIIADEAIDPTFGTGVVKITPAHDSVDFEIAKRHSGQLWDPASVLNVMTPDAKMQNVSDVYRGLDRFECRKRIIQDLEVQGLLTKTEDYKHSVGHCYRCKTAIEPRVSPQWFVKMKLLAELGIEAVQKDGMKFVPERWTKVYTDWLKNIRDWCISRQIWWGHQIPVWYCIQCDGSNIRLQLNQNYRTPNIKITRLENMSLYWESGHLRSGELGFLYKYDPLVLNYVESYEADSKKTHPIVNSNPPNACPRCGSRELFQDPDVLDTWFSSWLWPFSTLGWPEKTKDLATFYPTSVLVTGQDIIFFWVARMVMAGKFFLSRIPFKDVTIHGIIRVEGGKKMSKSLGNIIDPLEVIERMGTDALRFSIAYMASEGQDLYLSENKFLLGRNFANKLWNAARLILGDSPQEGHPAKQSVPLGTVPLPVSLNPRHLTTADRWILSRLQGAVEEVTRALEQYRFNEAARGLYRFLWNDFCDWYLEIAKLQREEADPAVGRSTDWILRHVLEVSLRLLHPITPFITEELWRRMGAGGSPEATIMRSAWPEPEQAWKDPEAEELFTRLQAVITEVRNIRATFRVPVKEKVSLTVQGSKGTEILARHEKVIQRLGGAEGFAAAAKVKRPAGTVVSHLAADGRFDAWDLFVPLAGLVDLGVERQRIQKEMENLESRIRAKRGRLEDTAFRGRAPANVVAEEEESLQELEGELSRWNESLRQLQ